MGESLPTKEPPSKEPLPSDFNPYLSTSSPLSDPTTSSHLNPESETDPAPSYTATSETDLLPAPLTSPSPNDDPNAVPSYTPQDQSTSLTTSLATLHDRATSYHLPLPLTFYPTDTPPTGTNPSTWTALSPFPPPNPGSIQRDIINTFHRAITTKNDELVTLFVRSGLVSPDVPNARGETPLIVAVRIGNGAMVCTLMGLGASVNLPGRCDCPLGGEDKKDVVLAANPLYSSTQQLDDQTAAEAGSWAYKRESNEAPGRMRTPLMVAAGRGNLALVKLLREDFGADDGVLAPDGQLALRLAAEGGFREVVAYLPARRGGEWRRWKAHHDVAVRRFKKAGRRAYEFVEFFVWTLPKFFLWSVPKHVVVLPVKRGAVWCWKNKKHFGGWCGRQVKEFPGRVKRGAEKVGRGVKAVGRGLKKLPEIVKRFVQWIWRGIKRIPEAMKIVGVWIWNSLKKVGGAVGDVFLKVVSALHTAVMAVLDFFRKITLKDVWNGICDVFEAIFISLPEAIWSGIKAFGNVSFAALKSLFGCFGEAIWWLFKLLLLIIIEVPKQLWRMLLAIGSSIAKGYHEFMVWINPKH